MNKSNSGFYTFLAILIAGISFFYSWKTILPKYQKTNREILTIENQTNAAKSKLSSLGKAKTDLDQLSDIVDKLFIAVPEGKDTPNLLTELEFLLTQLKLQVPTIQISGSDSVASAGRASSTSGDTVQISFSVTGSFEQLNSLVLFLERDVRFMNIKSVSFASADSSDLSMSLQIEAYKRPLAK